MNTISVPLENNTRKQTSYQVCQSKVCGDRWVGKVKTSESSRCRKYCHISFAPYLSLISMHFSHCIVLDSSSLQWMALWGLPLSASYEFPVFCFIIRNGKTNNVQETILMSSDRYLHDESLAENKTFHPVILGLDITANSKQHQTL